MALSFFSSQGAFRVEQNLNFVLVTKCLLRRYLESLLLQDEQITENPELWMLWSYHEQQK